MTRTLLLTGPLLWVGATLLLSRRRWFARPSLTERLRRHVPGGAGAPSARAGLLSAESFAAVIRPLAELVGDRLSALLGVEDDLARRLLRSRSPLDPSTFRVRQLGWTVGGLATAAAIVALLGPPAPLALLFLLGGPALGALLVEQQLSTACERRTRRLLLELPVVSEQLGMLLSAGYSLGGAIVRLAERSRGAAGEDLAVVVARMRHGVTEIDALREWAEVVDLDALTRLVAVLALNQEAGDLGRLIAEEARSVRREVQRQLVEQIERRSQQVWIPVTVSALVPGAIFIAIPFFDALAAFRTS